MRDHLQNFAQQLIADRVIELNNNISTLITAAGTDVSGTA
jgi:hypothetical protein